MFTTNILSASPAERTIAKSLATQIDRPEFADKRFWHLVGLKGLSITYLPPNKSGFNVLGSFWAHNQRIALQIRPELYISATPAAVMAHELGHSIAEAYRRKALEFALASEERQGYLQWMREWRALFEKPTGHFTSYAKTNVQEDIAESFMFYFAYPSVQLSSPRLLLCKKAIEFLVPNLEEFKETHHKIEANMNPAQLLNYRMSLWLSLNN
jgi:hypothetical protein